MSAASSEKEISKPTCPSFVQGNEKTSKFDIFTAVLSPAGVAVTVIDGY